MPFDPQHGHVIDGQDGWREWPTDEAEGIKIPPFLQACITSCSGGECSQPPSFACNASEFELENPMHDESAAAAAWPAFAVAAASSALCTGFAN